jgi:pyridinium-3,5-biscarboxylic acid mononucleotide sulfurtransferase
MRDQDCLATTREDFDGTHALASDTAAAKERRLATWLVARAPILIGFSGGVDSAYLACVAIDAVGSDRVLAVIGRSPSYPAEQWDAARRVAGQFGVPIREIDTRELDDPHYAANPSNRCFFCKSELWSRIIPIARAGGFATIVDGTNSDDLTDHRPGAAAGVEQGVLSPLALLGFTKAEIRQLSRRRGIPTWEQPSSPCLASRIPYGTAVTAERLSQIETAERALRTLGIRGDLRVRHHGDLARVELPAADIDAWLVPNAARRLRDAVCSAAGFARVAIDIRGYRSGSLNVLAGVTAS